MPYLIGQCYNNTIPTTGNNGGGDTGGGGGTGGGGTTFVPVLNEVIQFTNVSTLNVAWNGTRKSKFGDAPVFNVYTIGDDGKYRETQVEIIADSITAPTNYHFDFGMQLSGSIIIS